MNIAITHRNGETTVTLDGVLDYTTANQMESLIGDVKAIRASRVVVDLSNVPRVDSVGLGMLHLVKDGILESGARMVLRGAKGNVQRLFELTDSSHSFETE